MSSKIKNIIILVVVALVLTLVYVFFLKPAPATPALTTTATTSSGTNVPATASASQVANEANAISQDFLSLLLNIKNIKVDATIFSDPSFATLHDSSITLVQDPANEGRPNPFLPIGSDITALPINSFNTQIPSSQTVGNDTTQTIPPAGDVGTVSNDNTSPPAAGDTNPNTALNDLLKSKKGGKTN